MRIFALLFFLFLTSCVTLPTPSGQPEVVIPAGRRAAFTAHLTNGLLNERWSIAEQGADYMVFEQINVSEGFQMAFGGISTRPRARLNFVNTGGRVRVVVNLTVLSRNAFGRQGEEPVIPTRYVQMWQDRLKQSAGQG